MIERGDILSIAYLKKAVFTGSYEGMRFRFAAVIRELSGAEEEKTGNGEQVLEITVWEGPYAYNATSEEKKLRRDFAFSEEGIQEGIHFLNGLWEAEPEKWQAAKTSW